MLLGFICLIILGLIISCFPQTQYHYEYTDLDNNKGVAKNCSYKFEGYNVEANYFINDIGKQISMLLVGVEKLGNIETITFSDMLKLYIEIYL